MGTLPPVRPPADTGALVVGRVVPAQGGGCGSGLARVLADFNANRRAWEEDQVARGGAAIAELRKAVPVLRGASCSEEVPAQWRERFALLAQAFEDVLTARQR